MISFPAPPVIISFTAPPEILSTPLLPIIVSIPPLPVMVKPSSCAERSTLEPPVSASIVSILINFALFEKTFAPAASLRVSSPNPPSIVSVSPSPVLLIIKISSPAPPTKLSVLLLPVIV